MVIYQKIQIISVWMLFFLGHNIRWTAISDLTKD